MDLFELFPTTEMTYHGTREAMLDEEFFEFFGELGTGEEDYRDYLQKESRILSLVKKKKVVKERYTADPFMKAISANALREMNPGALFQYLRKMALKHLIEPVFEKIGPMYADQKDVLVEDLEPFMQTLFPSGVIQLREATPHEARLVSRCHTTRKKVPCVAGKTEDREFVMPLTGQLRACYRDTVRRFSGVAMRPALLMDEVSLRDAALVAYAEKAYHAYVQDLTKEGREEDHIVQTLYEEGKEFLRSVTKTNAGELPINEERFCQFSEELLERIGKDFGVTPVMVSPRSFAAEEVFNVLCFFYPELKCGFSNALTGRLRLAVKYIVLYRKAQEEEKQRQNYLKDLERGAARVYETKKNISEKYIRAMKRSRFNEMFGYVEFDTDCELKLIGEIEKEFLGFCQEYFSNAFGDRSFMDHSIRFRKLGRHHAWGLYFPGLQCLCVDIRNPGSFIHEFLHMIDFTSENPGSGYRTLSERHSFYKIRTRYEACLRKYIEEAKSDPIVAQLQGKTKYNLQYYLAPTEILARCGEIFFRRILNVHSSLLSECTEFCYPMDKELEEEIVRYYTELLKIPVGKLER